MKIVEIVRKTSMIEEGLVATLEQEAEEVGHVEPAVVADEVEEVPEEEEGVENLYQKIN